jgi:ribonuclease D
MYAAALYEEQGWGVEQFVADWRTIEELQHQGTLDGSIVAQAIIAFMRDKSYEEHVPSKLHAMIESEVGESLNLKGDKGWPKTGRTLWNRIKEVIPLLESRGIWASRSENGKLGRPIVLSTDPEDGTDGPDNYAKSVNDKVNDNADSVNDNPDLVDDIDPKNQLSSTASSTNTPDMYAENAVGERCGRYFGDTLGSHTSDSKKEIGGTYTQGESNPDLSSPKAGTIVAIDTETTGLNPMEHTVCILQYRVEGGEPEIIAREKIPAFLKSVEDCELIFHNGAFDLAMLKSNFGWTPKRRVWDTMVLSQLAYAGDRKVRSHGLKAVVEREIKGATINKDEQKSDWSGELTEEQVRYAKDDVRYLHEVRAALLGKMRSSEEIVEMEMDLVPLMADMFLRGVRVDLEGWREIDGEVEAYKNTWERKLDRFGRVAMKRLDPEPSDEWSYDSEFNWSSPKQVQEVAAVLGIDLPDTSDQTLALYIEHGFCKAMREYRKYSKRLSNYSAEAIAEHTWDDGLRSATSSGARTKRALGQPLDTLSGR